MVLELIESYIVLSPKLSIVIISFVVALFISVVNYFVMDKEKIKELKAAQKDCQARLKESKGDTNKIGEINTEMLKSSGEMMKLSFKPMLITFLPIIIVFTFIRGIYRGIGFDSWLWYYIGSSLVFSLILRKVFNTKTFS